MSQVPRAALVVAVGFALAGCQSSEEHLASVDLQVFGQILEQYVWLHGKVPATQRDLDRFQEESGLPLPRGGVNAYAWAVRGTGTGGQPMHIEVMRAKESDGSTLEVYAHPESVWVYKLVEGYEYEWRLYDGDWNYSHWVAAEVAVGIDREDVDRGMSSNDILAACAEWYEPEGAEPFPGPNPIWQYSEGMEVYLEPDGADLDIVILIGNKDYRYRYSVDERWGSPVVVRSR